MKTKHVFLTLPFFTIVVIASIVAYAEQDSEAEALSIMYKNEWDNAVFIVATLKQYGTAWWINSEGYAVTAAHVVEDKVGTQLMGIKGGWQSYCKSIYIDTTTDIAILKCDSMPSSAKIMPLDLNYQKGDKIVTIGYPQEVLQLTGDLKSASIQPRASFGEIAWIHPSQRWLMEVTSVTDAGNSGGPVVDVNSGGVVAIVSFALPGKAATLYYGTATSEVAKALEKLGISYEVAEEPTFGIISSGLLGGNEAVAVAVGLGAVLVAAVLMFAVRR